MPAIRVLVKLPKKPTRMAVCFVVSLILCAWGELNPHPWFRRPVLYPLSYRRSCLNYCIIIHYMADIPEQIEAVEKELRELPHHKGTDHHIGRLRAKLARLGDQQIENGTKKGSGGGGGYAVKKHGDATVILVGPPSAGKSTLINKLTNAESKVAAYAFTTLTVIPGMMEYKNAKIQILDVPGLIEGAGGGKGRGKEVMSVARNSDLIIFMTDPDRLDFFKKLVKELEYAGIRINKEKPQVKIEKT